MDCKIMHLPHTQLSLSLYLPLYLYQGCCSLLPAASSQSVRQTVQSLSPLSLYLSSSLLLISIWSEYVLVLFLSLDMHACFFLSFFQFSLPSLSLFSHLKSFWQREVIVEESSKILCGWLTATSMPLSPSLSFFHPPSLLLFSHSFSLSLPLWFLSDLPSLALPILGNVILLCPCYYS